MQVKMLNAVLKYKRNNRLL